MRQFLPPLALALILSACAARTPAPVEPTARPVPPPAPPTALSPIHQNISDAEKAFHLRAGLNVAALSCVQLAGPGIVADYNQFLAVKRPQLATAYEAKSARYRAQGGQWQRTMDTDMTRLYNHFASPTAQVAFCRQAAQEVKQAIAADPDGFIAWAQPALARLDAPFAAPALAAARAQPAVMSMAAGPRSIIPMASGTRSVLDLPSGWGIQLGAFSTKAKAEAAWKDVSSRSGALNGMSPHFEPVPGKSMTRLQVKGATSREDAIGLCAHAAAAGFDCIPVAPA